MIVFDLRCQMGHVFEAWFGSSAAFEDQRARNLVNCPVCNDATIEKAVMAPHVAPKGNRGGGGSTLRSTADLAALADAQAKILEESEWVGRAFPDRARAMHLGDEPAALIHGETSAAEARELIDEGIAIVPLPLPVVPPRALN